MKKSEIIEIIISTIKRNIDIDDVKENSSFMDDLDMSSMEIFSFIADLEEQLRIEIPEIILNKVYTVEELAEEIKNLI